jgi:cell division protein FtsN
MEIIENNNSLCYRCLSGLWLFFGKTISCVGREKMHCKKCDIEVTGGDEIVCPLCKTPLEEDDQDTEKELSDKLYEDQELRKLISSIAESVKKSQGKEHKIVEVAEENPFDLEKALSDEEKPLSLDDFSAAAQRNEYDKKKASLESALPKYDQRTVITKYTQRKISIKNIFTISVVLLAVAGSVIAAYFYALNEPQMAKETVPMPATMLPFSKNQQASTPEISIPSPAQPKETPGQLQEKTAPAAQAVNPAASEVTKEQIPEQKPAEQLQQKVAEPPKAATIVTAGYYAVNVGSFKLKGSVDGVMKVLGKKGYAPSVETVTLNDASTWYRVTVGQFKTREEAARFAKELEDKEEIKTMVVKRK